MSHARARKAIEDKLASWAAARPIRIAHMEEDFDAAPGETYLRAFLMPASSTTRYLAAEALEYRGIYQVSIICPAGQAMGTAEAIIDELSGLFLIDTPLSRNGFEGMIVEPVEQGPTITEPSVYTIPTSFTYLGQAEAP